MVRKNERHTLADTMPHMRNVVGVGAKTGVNNMTPQKYLQNAETYRRLAETHDLNARNMLRMVLAELDRALYWRDQAEAAEKAAEERES